MLASEPARSEKADTKTEVYTMGNGVFCLENACGGKPFGLQKYHQKRNYGRMGNVKVMITIDSKPNKNFYEEGVQLVIKLGLLC